MTEPPPLRENLVDPHEDLRSRLRAQRRTYLKTLVNNNRAGPTLVSVTKDPASMRAWPRYDTMGVERATQLGQAAF